LLSPGHIAGFERYLQERGCYAPSTVTRKVNMARSLQTALGQLPLDEDAAIDRIREVQQPGRRRRVLNTTARDLLEYFQAQGAV
jgi:hypothetical protein